MIQELRAELIERIVSFLMGSSARQDPTFSDSHFYPSTFEQIVRAQLEGLLMDRLVSIANLVGMPLPTEIKVQLSEVVQSPQGHARRNSRVAADAIMARESDFERMTTEQRQRYFLNCCRAMADFVQELRQSVPRLARWGQP